MSTPEVSEPIELIEANLPSLDWDAPEYDTPEHNERRLETARRLEVPAVFFDEEMLRPRIRQISDTLLAMRAIGGTGEHTSGYEQWALPNDSDVVHLEIPEGAMAFSRWLLQDTVDREQGFHPYIRAGEVSIYGNLLSANTEGLATKRLRMKPELEERISGLDHVVIWEDGVDTGGSLSVAVRTLQELGVTNIDLVAGTLKQGVEGQIDLNDHFRNIIYATRTPDVFLSGLGLDDPPNDRFRMHKAHMVSNFQKDDPVDIEKVEQTLQVMGDAVNTDAQIYLIDAQGKQSATGLIREDLTIERVPFAA